MAITGDRDQLAKVSLILEFLTSASCAQTWWGVREISKHVDIPLTTVHRTMGALAEIGYVRRDCSGRYAIGIDLMRIARQVRDADPLLTVARPHLEQLVRLSSESVLLARFDETTNSLVFIEFVVGALHRDYDVPLHKHLSLHRGASGLSVLSQLPYEIGTAPDGDSLRQIRARGVVLSRGHRIPGAVGIASPVISPGGSVVGSVTLTFPESRFPSPARCHQLEHLVWLCAQSIRRDLRGVEAVASEPFPRKLEHVRTASGATPNPPATS